MSIRRKGSWLFRIWVYNCRMFSFTRYSFLYSIAMRFIQVNSVVTTLLCTVMIFVEIVLCLEKLISQCKSHCARCFSCLTILKLFILARLQNVSQCTRCELCVTAESSKIQIQTFNELISMYYWPADNDTSGRSMLGATIKSTDIIFIPSSVSS